MPQRAFMTRASLCARDQVGPRLQLGDGGVGAGRIGQRQDERLTRFGAVHHRRIDFGQHLGQLRGGDVRAERHDQACAGRRQGGAIAGGGICLAATGLARRLERQSAELVEESALRHDQGAGGHQGKLQRRARREPGPQQALEEAGFVGRHIAPLLGGFDLLQQLGEVAGRGAAHDVATFDHGAALIAG